VVLTARLATAAVVLSAAALLVPGHPLAALLVADGLLVAAAATDVALAVRPGVVVRSRDHPPVVSVGRKIGVSLLLNAPRPVRVGIRDSTVPSLYAEPARLRTKLPAGTSRLHYRIAPSRRGRFRLGPVTVRTMGPLGLAGRQRTVPLVTELKVYPALEGRRQIEGRIRRSRVLEIGMKSARVRGGGLEFDMLREYHPDDEFRRINWAATARAGKAITNVFREERNQQVLLLLDAGRTMAGTVAGSPRFEHALDAAVAVATLAMEVGDRVGAFAFGERVRASVPPRSDAAQAARIVDALFDVDPRVTASDYLGSLGAVLSRYRRRAMLVLFTDLADESALDTLLATIPTLVRRHLVLVAEVADPEVERLARTVPVSAEEAFRKAAAAAAQLRRDRAAARLARLGASVIDRPPGELATALADEYLRAKAYARL
jgi:uncharacterized protein (DUF58 family)